MSGQKQVIDRRSTRSLIRWRVIAPAIAVGALILLLVWAGRSDRKPNNIENDAHALNELADVLSTITDMPTYEAAKPKLKVLYDAQTARRQRPPEQVSEKDLEAWWAEKRAAYPKYNEASQRYGKELDRLERIPDIYHRLMIEFILPSYGGCV